MKEGHCAFHRWAKLEKNGSCVFCDRQRARRSVDEMVEEISERRKRIAAATAHILAR